MNIQENHPPRAFVVGHADHPITLFDCAHIALDNDEQITLIGPTGSEFDITRKNWGYYATSSLNSRLLNFGLHAVLVRSIDDNKFFILLVEHGKNDEFETYLTDTRQEVIAWLDSDQALARFKNQVSAP